MLIWLCTLCGQLRITSDTSKVRIYRRDVCPGRALFTTYTPPTHHVHRPIGCVERVRTFSSVVKGRAVALSADRLQSTFRSTSLSSTASAESSHCASTTETMWSTISRASRRDNP